MNKKLLFVLAIIILIVILPVLNWLTLLSFLNEPVNILINGNPDTSCNIDSDCVLRFTSCGPCGCGSPVNKNWNREPFCPFITQSFSCAVCAAPIINYQIKCIENQCQKIFPQYQNVSLDDVIKNPEYYTDIKITVQGYVVKNVGAFFGETYFLQTSSGIQNFKNVSSSSTGIALVGNYNFSQIVSYTFDGRSYTPTIINIATISGIIHDRGNPPPTDVSRYYLEAQQVFPS